MRELQRCWEGFPEEGALDAANREWLGRKQALSICESDAAAKNETLRACMNETQGVLNGLRQAVDGLQLPFLAEEYQEAQRQFSVYLQRLQDLELARHKFIDARTHVQRLQEHLEEVQADVDALKGELLVLAGEKERLTRELEGLEARLAALGAEDIRRRSREVVARLNELPGLLKTAFRNPKTGAGTRRRTPDFLAAKRGFLAAGICARGGIAPGCGDGGRRLSMD